MLRILRNNLRVMRNLLTVLFPAARADILSACLLQPDKWWYLSELADHLGTGLSSLQREIESLTEAGILERRREGTRVYVKANTEAPIFPELRGLFEKTAGLLPALRLLLEPFREKILCAFVFGSVARRTEHAASDVDLMVIGDIGLLDLASPLRAIERRLGREVNATVFGAREFRTKMKNGDHFLTSVMRGRKEFVIGDESVLGGIAREQKRAEASHLEKRAR
jgi:predicted nucleotidyltransferase